MGTGMIGSQVWGRSGWNSGWHLYYYCPALRGVTPWCCPFCFYEWGEMISLNTLVMHQMDLSRPCGSLLLVSWRCEVWKAQLEWSLPGCPIRAETEVSGKPTRKCCSSKIHVIIISFIIIIIVRSSSSKWNCGIWTMKINFYDHLLPQMPLNYG